MRVRVKELPDSLQAALKAVGYGKVDIGVEIKSETEVQDFGADGCRAFMVIVNLSNGETCATYGSWGGPCAFTTNIVDSDSKVYTLPRDCAIIRGSEGGGRPVLASIILPPGNVVPGLLPAASTIPTIHRQILAVFRGIKSSYRQEYFTRMGVTNGEIDLLVAGGYLKRNKAGATSITTEGRNACEGVNVY